jgi:hypothetical protein
VRWLFVCVWVRVGREQALVVPALAEIPPAVVTPDDLAIIVADLTKLSSESREDEFYTVVQMLGSLCRKTGREW